MTREALQNRKDDKFFFDLNIFDEDVIEEPEEELPPPPPTFSEDELEAARHAAFAEGKKDGRAEATEEEQASRSTFVAQSLNKIAEAATVLFAEEAQRARRYEREATELSLSIFEKLFPVYNELYGFEELKQNISTILRKQQNQRKIHIHVSPANAAGVEAFLAELSTKGLDGNFAVEADETLGDRACRMRWDRGGASHDTNAMAEEIKSLMQQTLAGLDAKGHDSNSDDVSAEAEVTDDNEPSGTAPETTPTPDLVEKSDE